MYLLRKKSKAIIAIIAIFTVAVCACFFVTGAYAAPSVINDMKTWDNSEILNEVLTEEVQERERPRKSN